jgi:predicted dehydrogenase
MSDSSRHGASRREFLQSASRLAAASALATVAVPHVHAAENNTLQVAHVGCGGRGTGAAVNALSTTSGPIKLVAMADVFEANLKQSHAQLTKHSPAQVDVPHQRRFVGFDGYKKAMDCLRPGDLVLLATPPAFRWVHFAYAIEKGLNVFMEKPVAVDGPSSRKMLALGQQAAKKNLKVGVGLMCRHCQARGELLQRIQDGQIGEIIAMRAYRMIPVFANAAVTRRTENLSELLWQIRRFHSFLWASGGIYSDAYIHNIDECCWMKGAWPVEAQASGGRHYRGDCVDQNFDNYSVEYTFPDGTKLLLYARTMNGCYDEFASFAQASKGSAVISSQAHTPAKCRIYKGYQVAKKDLVWAFPQPEPNPYQLEWDALVEAIRQDKPYNEVQRGVEASVAAAMGRMAAHTGQVVTFDDMLHCEHEMAPGVDKLTMDSPAPVLADAQGRYPVPQPGILKHREY